VIDAEGIKTTTVNGVDFVTTPVKLDKPVTKPPIYNKKVDVDAAKEVYLE
jgi:hypothetical protein